MTEADFRDWVRGVLGGLEARVKVLEARPQALPPDRPGKRLKGGMIELAEGVLKAVKGGEVVGLAVAYLGPDGMRDGWSSAGFDNHLRLLGAVTALSDDLMHPEDRVERFLDEEEAA